MRKVKNIKKVVAVMIFSILFVSTVANAASSGSTYINGQYGWLYGTINGYMDDMGKTFNTDARTTNAVSRIRASLQVVVNSTGSSIGSGATSGWVSNTNYATTYDYSLFYFKTGGYANTVVTAYGTSDAITSTPYVVYTTYTY